MRHIFMFLLIAHFSFAQSTFKAERIFLALEKESCMPGDTLLVNGQVLSSNSQDFYPYSRYIYVECIDQQDSLLLRQKITCDEKGYFSTAIPTQFEWKSNICYLRAYTRLMQNYQTESIPTTPFFLGTVHPQKQVSAREIHIQLFPEGGKLLNGFQQNIVFHLSDDDGFPISSAQVSLLSEKNDTIRHHTSISAHGLGRISFIPQIGKHYHLQVEYDKRFFTFPLQIETTGASLQAIINRNCLSCRIISNLDSKAFHLFLYHSDKGLQEIPIHPKQSFRHKKLYPIT